ncbi:MAG: hypothetical protein HUU47_06975 [Bacteroidetes bacterium]|nr:hypothetical protein [Bacteroidota bacterium]
MQKLIFTLCLLSVAFIASSQKSNLDKAENAINEKYYERAFKLLNDAIEDDVTKKNPLTYFLRAICLYELSKDEFFLKKHPDAISEACKMVLKGKDKDKTNRYKGVFDLFISDLVIKNDSLAEEEYKVNRYPKAIKIYNISVKMNNDTFSYYMIGKCYQMAADTANAKYYYKNLINWYNETNKSGNKIRKPVVEPFLFLADVYWFKKDYDSANYYLDVATTIFGEKNTKINYYQYLIAKEQITTMPPSSIMLEVITKALKFSPTDTFFIKKENALNLYLIRNYIEAKDSIRADTLIFRFARNKALKANDQFYDDLKKVDIFLHPLPENILWKMSDYYYVNTHDKASAYLAKKYIIKTSTANDSIKPTDKDIIARWLKIIDFARENESPGYLALLINQACTDYPKSKELSELKKKLLTK